MLRVTAALLDEIATALQDQEQFEHRHLIDPATGELAFWTSDNGVGDGPVDLDELDLVAIDPLPSYVWYQDMADFADGVRDERAARRLHRALDGKGAFRRFRNELHEEYRDLLPAWHAFRDARARERALAWLVDEGLVDEQEARRFRAEQPPLTAAGPTHQDVVDAELALLDPQVRVDADRVEELLDPEFTEIGASGRLWTRDETLAALAAEPAGGPPADVDGLTVTEVADGVVLIRYVSDRAGRRARRSSLWRRTEGTWRLLHHQGTPL